VTTGLLLACVARAQELSGCHSVKGKITNNFSLPTAFHTLGVAAVVFGANTKLKCALEGTPAVPPDNTPGSVAFTHTISCDDAIGSAYGPVHSRLQLNTIGTVNQDGSFVETSTPIEGTGTGLFGGIKTDGSVLNIEGQIFPSGAIDMKFTGQACY